MDVNNNEIDVKRLEDCKDLQSKLQQLTDKYSDSYNEKENDLRFNSGDQWPSELKKARMNKPMMVLPYCQQYVNRIVNPLRQNPLGINVEGNDESIELIKQAIKNIEHKSNATESFEQAFEAAVTCGLGWIGVTTDYRDEYSLEQDIKIETIKDPLSCYIDPFSEAIDGSDAEWGIRLAYLDEDIAKNKYGNEVLNDSYNSIMFSHWNVPEGAVCELSYYYKVYEEKQRYFMTDGSILDNPEVIPNSQFVKGTRTVKATKVKLEKYVGSLKVFETELNTRFIPLIPVYGNKTYDQNRKIDYTGIISGIKDIQRMINYYASSEAELVASAPKSQWVAAEGQVEGYEKLWANANNTPVDTLIYRMTDIEGRPAPAPSRIDNTAQTQGLIASRTKAEQDLARATGIFDNLLGSQLSGEESGKAVLLRNQQGETVSAQFLQNLSKSIKQVGNVVLELMFSLYDTERPVQMADGEVVSVNLKDLPLNYNDLDVTVDSGPAYESKRKEIVSTLYEVGRLMPDKAGILADLMMRNIDSPIAREAAERLKKLLPPELKDEQTGIDPEAEQALQAAQQTISSLEQGLEESQSTIIYLQTMIMDNEKDRQSSLIEAQIKSQTDLAEAQIKAETDLEKERLKANTTLSKEQLSSNTDIAKETIKQENENARQINDIAADASKEIEKTIQEEIKSQPKVNVDINRDEELLNVRLPNVPGGRV
jgi:hypothetical protein